MTWEAAQTGQPSRAGRSGAVKERAEASSDICIPSSQTQVQIIDKRVESDIRNGHTEEKGTSRKPAYLASLSTRRICSNDPDLDFCCRVKLAMQFNTSHGIRH